jgi:hypothetical protein
MMVLCETALMLFLLITPAAIVSVYATNEGGYIGNPIIK